MIFEKVLFRRVWLRILTAVCLLCRLLSSAWLASVLPMPYCQYESKLHCHIFEINTSFGQHIPYQLSCLLIFSLFFFSGWLTNNNYGFFEVNIKSKIICLSRYRSRVVNLGFGWNFAPWLTHFWRKIVWSHASHYT